jgi:hypothetical protein
MPWDMRFCGLDIFYFFAFLGISAYQSFGHTKFQGAQNDSKAELNSSPEKKQPSFGGWVKR